MILISSFKQQLISSSTFRWVSSFVFVVFVCANGVLAALYWNVSSRASPAKPMAAMMIDLAPMPVAPEIPPNVAPPGPAQEEVPTPPEPIPEPVPEIIPEPTVEPLPKLPVIKEAEVLLPKLLPEPEPEPIEIEVEPLEEKVAQEDKATPAFEALPDEIAAAPIEGAVSITPSQALATWQSALLGHLEHHKRYPRKARLRKQEAVVYVRISINRKGAVLNYRLTQPSAYKVLNQETLALIARAQPLPPPPPDIKRNTVEFVVPVEFFLR